MQAVPKYRLRLPLPPGDPLDHPTTFEDPAPLRRSCDRGTRQYVRTLKSAALRPKIPWALRVSCRLVKI